MPEHLDYISILLLVSLHLLPHLAYFLFFFFFLSEFSQEVLTQICIYLSLLLDFLVTGMSILRFEESHS